MRDEELTSVIDEVRLRIRARYPEQPLKNNPAYPLGPALPDLMPLLHARDAAEAKVAAIGTVNPRLPGIGNAAIQWTKRKIARGLNWHVRDQVAFNQAALDCVQAALEALTDVNRALAALERNAVETREQRETSDIIVLRTIAEMQASIEQRTAELEQSFHESLTGQHTAFEESLAQSVRELRNETERQIHTELRLIRQRASLDSQDHLHAIGAPCGAEITLREPGSGPAHAAVTRKPSIDWLKFAGVFRGPEEHVRKRHRRHIPRFAGCADVLDIGCGRGEFLESAREAGIAARGIDQNAECVALCRSKGLAAETADLFTFLDATENRSLAGVFCAHVVEHLDPLSLPILIELLSCKLQTGGVLVIETPNPENAETMARHFWIDPTHTRPVPVALLRFYLEESGFGQVELEMGADYAVCARQLA